MQKPFTNKVYGCDIDELIAEIKDSVTYKVSGAYMIVAGLMSDAQELIAFERAEQARQTLNCAKAVLFKIMDGELVGTVERV
jgi:hypothetical protein